MAEQKISPSGPLSSSLNRKKRVIEEIREEIIKFRDLIKMKAQLIITYGI
jgi:hypothetical protein